jgi:hypothetical protein
MLSGRRKKHYAAETSAEGIIAQATALDAEPAAAVA